MASSTARGSNVSRCRPTSASPSKSSAFLDAVGERFGVVDVLVNNAGGQFAAPLESIALKGMRAVHRLNVDATWDVTQRVAERWMIPRRSGFVAFLGFSPRRGDPDDDPFIHGEVRARDVRRGDRAGMVEVRDPRGVHRRRVDPDRGHPAVRRAGGRGRVRDARPDAARGSPRRGRGDDRVPGLARRGLRHRHDDRRGRWRRRVGDGNAPPRTRARRPRPAGTAARGTGTTLWLRTSFLGGTSDGRRVAELHRRRRSWTPRTGPGSTCSTRRRAR